MTCPVADFPSISTSWAALLIQLFHRHVQDTIVVLWEGNLPLPQCPQCDMFSPGRHWMGDTWPWKYETRDNSGSIYDRWKSTLARVRQKPSRPMDGHWIRCLSINTSRGSWPCLNINGRGCFLIWGRPGVSGRGFPGFGLIGGRWLDLQHF